MNNTSQKFIHAGFGSVLCANRVVALLNPATASARRLAKAAREAKRPCYVDMSFGRATKCLVLQDDGTVLGCALTCRTLMARLNAESPEPESEEKDGFPCK